jgi:hypothetical protein
MYNRYIPQPDGSYRKNAMPESRQNVQMQASQRPAPPTPPPPPPVQQRPPRQDSIPSFLRQLIPQGFDTGDLIIVLLLLLIAGDSQESRSNALLTLALYFIL